MVHMSTTAEVGEFGVRALRDVTVLDVLQKVEFEGLLTPTLFSWSTRDRCHFQAVIGA